MKSLAPSQTRNSENLRKRSAQRSTPDAQRCAVIVLGTLLFTLTGYPLHAQVGNDNPTGWSGSFNGLAGGCGYDPYTANAIRSITDISVAGAVGEYPLALVRTANSRSPSTTEVFGWVGGWNHNYNWILEDSPHRNNANYPDRYTVEFPDGRVETFRAVTWDSYYRVRPGPATPPQSGSAGVRERLQPIHQENGNLYADLILPDGGKVEFQAFQRTDAQGKYFYTYKATAIIDPYGQKTTLQWETVNGRRRLTKVTEPAGRYLEFSYNGTGRRIRQVQEFIGNVGRRIVQYYYIGNGLLDQVVYYGNAAWTAKYQYVGSNIGGDLPLLLKTCDDPMYAGPMKRIAYHYKPAGPNPDGSTPVYGQILSERYYDGTNIGVAVSTLAVGTDGVNTGAVYRKETRGDGRTRGFIYNGAGPGYLGWVSDFMGHQSTKGYDDKKYLNSFIDFNRNETNYINDPITGKVTQLQFPAITSPSPAPRGTVKYTYTNKYYLDTNRGENGFTTTINRYGDNRIQNILYPDGGSEWFTYDQDHLYQVATHQMTTGGTESWTYDARHRKETYRNPDNPEPGVPSIRYYYNELDRVNGIYDALNHPTNWEYNDRGQLTKTTLTADPVDGQRHTIVNAYNLNGDGTLVSKTDELNHVTRYEYDDYRRLTKVTPPIRGYNDNSEHPTQYFYDANGTGPDYRYTDSNVTYVKLPSTKKIQALYDDNRRKRSVTVGYGSSEAATTSFTYDSVGNLRTVTNPLDHNNVDTLYDERNRPYSISVGGQTTTMTYDTAGRRKTITRSNGQVITNVSFDNMNRVTQQSATNAGTTKYSYHPGSGLLYTMQDPRLVALGRDPDPYEGYVYTYLYDPMGRKSVVGYPPDSGDPRTFEAYTYDSAGRLYTFMNRNGKTQTFEYDALNRLKDFYWNDGITPRVDLAYDAASRLTSVTNANAPISRGYFNDNLLRTETETATGGVARTVNYTYDADGNQATLGIPGYSFTYGYTGRNQLLNIKQGGTTLASYVWDPRGNITSRTLNNGTHSDYTFDVRDRLTWVTHSLNGTTRMFNYGYYDDSNNRKYTRRLYPNQDVGEVFGYDRADQVIAVLLDVEQPHTKLAGDPTIAMMLVATGLCSVLTTGWRAMSLMT